MLPHTVYVWIVSKCDICQISGLAPQSGSADGNLDYLLALHLAQDLNSADGHHGSINTYEGDDRWEPLVESTQRLSLSELSPLSPTQDFSTDPEGTGKGMII